LQEYKIEKSFYFFVDPLNQEGFKNLLGLSKNTDIEIKFLHKYKTENHFICLFTAATIIVIQLRYCFTKYSSAN
jgi:hypothetical protein